MKAAPPQDHMWPFGKSKTAALRRNLAHAEGFRSRLETDRLRADRMGIALTLVTVRWTNGVDPGESTALAFDVIDNRLRATDEIGRLTDTEIGIVLWDTDEAGATIFVDRLLRDAPGELKFQATLFVYPSRSKPNAPVAKQTSAEARQSETSSETSSNDKQDPHDSDPNDSDQQNDPRSGSQSESDDHTESVAEPAVEEALASVTVESLEPAMTAGVNPVRRAVDLVGSIIGLTLAAPILIAAATAIKLSNRGPVFFLQERAGLGGRPFRIYKLRTMCIDAEAKKQELLAQSEQDGAAFKLTKDPRVFAVGEFLRKTSIDELPQLINVLRGEMSIVGPRPLPVSEAERVAGWQRRRLDVLPGLTCIWQVEGRSRVTFVEWMRMDMQYIKRRGLLQDMRLMFATIPAVLMRRGAK